MEIGGYDNILHTPKDPAKATLAFLGKLKQTWPEMRTSILCGFNENGGSRTEVFAELEEGELPSSLSRKGQINLLIYRDREMERISEVTGGRNLPDGQGMIQILYRHKKSSSSAEYEITLVTAAAPSENDFARLVCDILEEESEGYWEVIY